MENNDKRRAQEGGIHEGEKSPELWIQYVESFESSSMSLRPDFSGFTRFYYAT